MEISEEQIKRYKTACLLNTEAVTRSKDTERGQLLTEMLQIVNFERLGTKYPQMNIKVLGVKLGHIPTKDLYYIKSVGLDYKNRNGSFSKYLWGSLKTKKL